MAVKRLLAGAACGLLGLAGSGCGATVTRQAVRAGATGTPSSLPRYADVAGASIASSSLPVGHGFTVTIEGQGQPCSSSHWSSTCRGPGPTVSRPPGKSLPPGTHLATAPTSVIQGALQADFDGALSGEPGFIGFDASTNAANATVFFKGQQSRLSLVSIIPTVTSTGPQSDGSVVVNFTAGVIFMGAAWPTHFGILTATLTPKGTMILTHASLCELASAMLISTCPF